jgi:pilus assembly protein CpaE
VGITHEDVEAIIGRPPDVLVPSTRDIPISVNDGTPIVLADERSEIARAFRKLADAYTHEEEESGRPPLQLTETPEPPKRRFAWKS